MLPQKSAEVQSNHEEQGKVLARSWKTACYYVVHLHVSLILVLIYEFFRKRDVSSLIWLAACLVVYGGLLDPNRKGGEFLELVGSSCSSPFANYLMVWGCLNPSLRPLDRVYVGASQS